MVCFQHSCKYYTRVKVNGSNKHSSLLRRGINCGSKKCYNTGPKIRYRSSNFSQLLISWRVLKLICISNKNIFLLTRNFECRRHCQKVERRKHSNKLHKELSIALKSFMKQAQQGSNNFYHFGHQNKFACFKTKLYFD
jgi:hypothetical protein